ncbi:MULTISPECIES: DUF484 family protein [unclassified Polaromonas]|uniref:DUF484 family protein n=1 Tax=unclassified Polaromonas TaxID=2638319 RepID=UPI0018CAABC3|nr:MULTISPECIES: DUF484 family protein [unclassified Polaromonas]MBG6070870.1 uncharacterized protein YigA (DUF484 family) [Polaromonas sp. CG_9.7]MBG6112820.1 uncharacterized protein YigA (DUF484 family) [Polaromonas sp. CG_9.2]MDH6186294.1 uncharacterized protein YigA (DUF484 family) [Polaromonas sp. CG_23.6]
MNPAMNLAVQPVTEDDIADFLANQPDFFERHAELLASVQLFSGHGDRAISLQERQASLLREKIKALETRVLEMVGHGQDNLVIAGRMQSWTRRLLQTAQARDLPGAIVEGLASEFQIPQAAIRLWGVDAAHGGEDFAQAVSDDVQRFAASLTTPYCGVNTGFEAARWLPHAGQAQSLALIALRASLDAPMSGLLVLASPDAQRFHSGMGTEFLERLGELAGAALSRLQLPVALPAAEPAETPA